jgi:hypothetical protein
VFMEQTKPVFGEEIPCARLATPLGMHTGSQNVEGCVDSSLEEVLGSNLQPTIVSTGLRDLVSQSNSSHSFRQADRHTASQYIRQSGRL